VPEIFADAGAFLGLPKNAHFSDTTYIPDDYFGIYIGEWRFGRSFTFESLYTFPLGGCLIE
jgi:hypothetical protein